MRSGERRLQCGTGRARGFTYLLVLFALAAMGLTLAGTGQVWQVAAQRDREAELLFIGNQFRQAIGSYYRLSPDGSAKYPATLQDLVEDPRFPTRQRHLRRLYRDPITGGFDWGLVRAGDRIVGVHSLSQGTPLKTAFEPRDAALQGALRYDQWVFRHDPGQAGPQPAPNQVPRP
jgi:type II secretory pathway pseudopilin PulG